MPIINKGMIQSGNYAIPDQFYDEKEEKFVLVSEDKPYPIKVLPKHKSFVASQSDGDWGFYTTVEDNQVISFEFPLNALFVETKDNPLKIKINENLDYWYIDAFSNDGIEDIAINRIEIAVPAGAKIRYKGLII